MHTAFTAIDAVIVLGYLAALAAVGVYFSRRQTTIDDFFVARRSMAWLPVGLSLMAALNSGIDYLMQPSATIRFGVVLLAGTTSWIIIYPWVTRVTLPFYRRLNSYTAYEFLEARFDARVRMLAAAIFVVWRIGWMATALYVPCLAIDAATGGHLGCVTRQAEPRDVGARVHAVNLRDRFCRDLVERAHLLHSAIDQGLVPGTKQSARGAVRHRQRATVDVRRWREEIAECALMHA